MKRIVMVATMMAIVATVGVASPAGAEPDDSQRLRGLGGRTFVVDVEVLAVDDDWPFPSEVGDQFENCYGFDADGTWSEAGIPVPGTWDQLRNGASTDYNATIEVPGLLLLVQEGHIGPAGGRGVLQLEAVTVVTVGGASATFGSIGSEADCDPRPSG